MEQTLCNIDIGTDPFFIKCIMKYTNKDAEFNITLVNASTMEAWEGSFGEDVTSKAEDLDMSTLDYIAETKKALTRKNMGDLEFEYQVKSVQKGSKEFSWKKVFSTIKFQLGSVTLQPVKSVPNVMKDIILQSIKTAADLNSTIYHLEGENDRLSNERTQALKRLEKCVDMKEQMESDLYAKFAAILNEKKAKIRQMRDMGVESLDSTGDDGIEGQRSNSANQQRYQVEDEEAMDIDSEDVDTDEERERSTTTAKKAKQSVAAPETSRTNQDDSIVFAEEESETVSKARRRRRQPQVKKTPSSQKVAIPRTPSTGTPSTSGMPAVKKTRSIRSTGSDDVDDLLNDI